MFDSLLWKKFLIRIGLAGLSRSWPTWLSGYSACLPYASDRILASNRIELNPYELQSQDYSANVIDLNCSTWQAPELSRNRSSDSSSVTQQKLRECLDLGTFSGARYSFALSTHILATWAAILDAFVNPGDRVVSFDPAPANYAAIAEARRAKVRWVPSWVDQGKTRYLPETLRSAMRGAMLLLIASPNNPSGGELTVDDWEHIAWYADRHDVLVVWDQSWEPKFASTHAVLNIPKLSNRLFVMNSFAGIRGYADLPFSWLHGPKELVQMVEQMILQNGNRVNLASMQQAIMALKNETNPTAECQSRRRYAVERLRALGYAAEDPQHGYFLWIPVSPLGHTGESFAKKLFQDQDVVVGAGENYGPSGQGYIRLSVAIEDGRLREGLTRMGKMLATKVTATEVIAEKIPVAASQSRIDEKTEAPQFSRS